MAEQQIEHRKSRSILSTRFSVFNWRSRSVSKLPYCFGERIHWFCVWTEYETEGRYKWKIYINALLKIFIFVRTGLFTIVSIYKYNQNHFIFFFLISCIFNSVNSEALICMRKPNSEGSKKGRFHDSVILLFQIPSGFCFLLQIRAFVI